MATRRSIKEYLKGLQKQVDDAQEALSALRVDRDKEMARRDVEIAAQVAKVDALQGVVTQMTPAVPSRKAATKKKGAQV